MRRGIQRDRPLFFLIADVGQADPIGRLIATSRHLSIPLRASEMCARLPSLAGLDESATVTNTGVERRLKLDGFPDELISVITRSRRETTIKQYRQYIELWESFAKQIIQIL